MQMIPAAEEIKKTLHNVKKGDLISLDGYLVSVSGESGRRWDTSLSQCSARISSFWKATADVVLDKMRRCKELAGTTH